MSHGKAEFIIGHEALSDLIGEHKLIALQCLEAFKSHSDEISEWAGRELATGVAARGRAVAQASRYASQHGRDGPSVLAA